MALYTKFFYINSAHLSGNEAVSCNYAIGFYRTLLQNIREHYATDYVFLVDSF